MKLGKKKTTDEAASAQPEKKSDKKADKTAKGPSHKKLASVVVQQAVIVLLAGVAAAALLYLLVIQPASVQEHDAQSQAIIDNARSRIEQRLSVLTSLVDGYAAQPLVRQAVEQDRQLLDDMQAGFSSLLPQVTSVFLFPYGEIPVHADAAGSLGFASLDLAGRAESSRPLAPDAFPRDGQWYIQIAAPVRNATSKAIHGTLLVIMDASVLAPALHPEALDLPGKLSLVQTVNGQSQTVLSSGDGAEPVLTRSLSAANWTLAYAPSAAGLPVVNPVMAMLAVLVPVVLAAILISLLMLRAQRDIRRDVATLIQWAHKAFGGDRARLPPLRWDMVSSVGEVLQRLAQAVEKRLTKTSSGSTATKAKAKEVAESTAAEPMFQNDDVLDIDMLDSDEDVLGFSGHDDAEDHGAGGLTVEEAPAPGVQMPASIFRAYDIRGIVGDTLTPELVAVIGQAIGSEAISRQSTTICIGYDGRHSSPELADALARGIIATGCDVIELGAIPTPVLYFATHHLQTGSGVMVTGSHNPANYNGLKMMLDGETLSGDAIQKLLQRINNGDFERGQGQRTEDDVRRAYLDRIIEDIAVAAPLKVVLDAGNGIAGELGPILVEELGCDVIPLYCEVDGDFPNHHPDPGKPDNLKDLIERVRSEKADIGLAFDGDGDRLGVVTNTGKIIWPDRLMMLFARDVVSRNPGADVIYDVKCSRRLATVISQAGGRPIMWKTGHSLIKAKMRETGALLAGEMSGHVFFKERWYGFDDGLYSAARLLEILGVEDRTSDEVFEEFPDDLSTPELNVEVTDENKFDLVARLSEQGDFGEGNVNTIDGVRVDFPDGWGLCRASNTTPVLVLRFEAESEAALENIKTVFRDNLKRLAPELDLTF